MKWKIILVAILSIASISGVNAACEYTNEITSCNAANTSNSTREVEDFVCINATPEIFTYQIILDAKFKKIDEEIEGYIAELEENKGYYFGIDKEKSYLEAINNIVNIYGKTGDFGKQYYLACNGSDIASEVIACKDEPGLTDIFGTGSTSVNITNAAIYYGDQSTLCTQLADVKLAIYKKVSYDILLLNKLQISQDEKKLYVQQERSKYDGLLSKIMINLGYVERIWAKWPSKVKNVSGG